MNKMVLPKSLFAQHDRVVCKNNILTKHYNEKTRFSWNVLLLSTGSVFR